MGDERKEEKIELIRDTNDAEEKERENRKWDESGSREGRKWKTGGLNLLY